MKGDDARARQKSGGLSAGSSRPITRPRLPPGPLNELKGLLHQAYLAAGAPTASEMERMLIDGDLPACPSRDTIIRILSSREVPKKQADILALVRVLTKSAAGDADHASKEAARLWSQAQLAEPLGMPIEDVDPYDLEVHRAIDLSAAELGGTQVPNGLPKYVRRGHDDRLEELVDAAIEGHSGLALLVGTSSTGKTRACWEAIQRLKSKKWRLWHPLHPDRPRGALAELAQVRPRTVVWLNEAHEYLLHPEHGESVVAGLRVLLADDRLAPVLILGTIWPGPGYFDDVAYPPDPHHQVRVLFAGRALSVPSQFDPDLVDALRTSPDPRLAQAANRARDGMITQYLAAAPELLQLCELVQPGPRALLSAAMDARWLGHPKGLPLPFLAAAAEAYFSDSEWDLLPDNWCEQALSLLTRPVKGTRGPLHLQRPPRGSKQEPSTGSAAADRVYELADILEQHGRETRRDTRVPGSFWAAAIRHCTGDAARALAEQAERMGLLEQACRLWLRANDPFRVGSVLSSTGRTEEARPWFEQAAHQGHPRAASRIAVDLARDGRFEEALIWCKREMAAKESITTAAWSLIVRGFRNRNDLESQLVWHEAADAAAETWTTQSAGLPAASHSVVERRILELAIEQRAGELETMAHHLARAERWEEALEWFERAAVFSPTALGRAARRLAVAGRREQALTYYARAAAHGDSTACNEVWDLLATSNPPHEALDWLDGVSAAGRAEALFVAATRLAENGDLERAMDWYGRAAEAGHPRALGAAAARAADAGEMETALIWYERASAAGDSRALGHAAARLAEAGHLDTALTWYERAAAAGDAAVLHYAAGWLARAGRIAEAINYWERAVGAGYLAAAGVAAEWMVHTGRFDDALAWYERVAQVGAGSVRALQAVPLALAGRWDMARAAWLRAQEVEHRITVQYVADLVARRGGVDVALEWLSRVPGERDAEVLLHEALLNERAQRPDAALRCYREAGAAGSMHALRQAARLLVAGGQLDEALRCLDDAARKGDQEALTDAADHLARAGRVDEALIWYERAAVAGYDLALVFASWALTDAGRTDEAQVWRQRAVVAGLEEEADMATDGKPEAEEYVRQVASDPTTVLEDCENAVRKGRLSIEEAASALEEAGQVHVAGRLRRFGWAPDGGVARAWELAEVP
ncbi:hypothetical protein [Streptomyces sp. VNUA24]|uniref:tetratricopeptide repeat protein n=1 Tax=Streptomyces sp. VNUA24 TaxID=3031131 RepID=UPI0023B7FCCE|nr:hypothetical protein [Streptomyces sp. VNUA24]WEH12275.1 hypothetical protein PYR72_00565 [Streptomyces sp. VNUA24]